MSTPLPFAYRIGQAIRDVPSAIGDINAENQRYEAERAREEARRAEAMRVGTISSARNLSAGLTGGTPTPMPTELPAAPRQAPVDVGPIERAVAQRQAQPTQPHQFPQWLDPQPGPPVPWRTSQARDNFEADRNEQEIQRHRIIRRPDGGFTNLDGPGEMLIRDGENVGPDVGRPGRGGLSMTGGDEAYQNYRRNLMGDADYEAERADISRNRTLAADPFAEQNAGFARQVALMDMQTRMAEQRANAGRQWDSEMRTREASIEMERLDAYKQIDDNPAFTPERKAQLKQYVDQQADIEKLNAGIDPRKYAALGTTV